MGIGGAGNQGFSSASTQEKENGNKRKYMPEFPIDIPVDQSSLSLMEFRKCEISEAKFRNTLNDFEPVGTRFDQLKDVQETDEFQPADWDDPMACQLEDLLSQNLYTTFMTAIKKIVELGYSEEAAELAVLRSGLYYGGKDTVSNIVDGALVFLSKEKELDTSRHQVFEVLQNLIEYLMVEMICVLRVVRPSLTVAEAMWRLLIYDLNLSHACVVEGDSSSGFYGEEVQRENSASSVLPQLKSETSETSLSNPTKQNSVSSVPNPRNLCSENPAVEGIRHICEMAITKKESLVTVPEAQGKSLGSTKDLVQTVSETTVIAEKSGSSRKGYPSNFKRDVLRQKTFHFEKCYKGRMSKGAFKAKLTTWGSMVTDKMKCPESSGVITKNAYSKASSALGTKAMLMDGIHHLSSNVPSVLPTIDTPATLPINGTVTALPATNTNSASLTPGTETKVNTQTKISSSPKVPDYYAGIPYDGTLNEYVPQDQKDEKILALVPRLKALQKELQGWTDWANNKVMEVARTLSKEQAELKMLRQEKGETENFKKEKQILEDNTMKRLSEMEDALCNAAGQIEMANSTVYELEVENSALKEEMEAARLEALRSSANLQEAMLKEQEALKKAQLWEVDKGLLQEELKTAKRHVSDLQQEVAKANALQNQIEALWKQEEREKIKLQVQASSVRKEREQLATLVKAKEDKMRQNAENEMRGCKEDVTKLRREVSELMLESESSKIAALRRGIDVGYDSGLTGSRSAHNFERYQTSEVPKKSAVVQDSLGPEIVKPEHECVMCMTDEMSVVFIPCAHQVLCIKCNVLHEKQGMNDCPSCRTPIQRRVVVHFASNKCL